MNTAIGLRAPRTRTVDLLRSSQASWTLQAAGVIGFALLTALGAQFRIYLWEVPFTLQTLAVYGSGLFLGWRNGFLAQVLYLALGLLFPVYAGDSFGPAYLFGAVTAGYLLAYPFSALAIGAVSKRWNGLTGSMLSMVAGSAILFTMGVIWLHYAAGHATWLESLERGWLRFIPVDMAKILLVGLLYTGIRGLSGAASASSDQE